MRTRLTLAAPVLVMATATSTPGLQFSTPARPFTFLDAADLGALLGWVSGRVGVW
jgi:hypothetical protein